MKRWFSGVLCLLMLICSLCIPASAAELTSFSDVPESRWSHDAIMEMVSCGMFTGTKAPDANGVGEFSPEATMTREQFVTVIVRYLYPERLAAMPAGAYWYSNSIAIAEEEDLYYAMPEKTGLLTREEAAMLAINAANKQGEFCHKTVEYSAIPDVFDAHHGMRGKIVSAYSLGLITGTDALGTFQPKATVTREQGAMIAYRLMNPAARVYPPGCDPALFDTAPITIYEGQDSPRPAKEGDIFVKADGTQVVLKKGPHGILGEGQCVAPDKNLRGKSGHWTGTRFNFTTREDGEWIDGTGTTLQNNNYWVNASTGEGHWYKEWRVLEQAYPAPEVDGTYSGQVSTDPFRLYWWSSILDIWLPNMVER